MVGRKDGNKKYAAEWSAAQSENPIEQKYALYGEQCFIIKQLSELVTGKKTAEILREESIKGSKTKTNYGPSNLTFNKKVSESQWRQEIRQYITFKVNNNTNFHSLHIALLYSKAEGKYIDLDDGLKNLVMEKLIVLLEEFIQKEGAKLSKERSEEVKATLQQLQEKLKDKEVVGAKAGRVADATKVTKQVGQEPQSKQNGKKKKSQALPKQEIFSEKEVKAFLSTLTGFINSVDCFKAQKKSVPVFHFPKNGSCKVFEYINLHEWIDQGRDITMKNQGKDMKITFPIAEKHTTLQKCDINSIKKCDFSSVKNQEVKSCFLSVSHMTAQQDALEGWSSLLDGLSTSCDYGFLAHIIQGIVVMFVNMVLCYSNEAFFFDLEALYARRTMDVSVTLTLEQFRLFSQALNKLVEASVKTNATQQNAAKASTEKNKSGGSEIDISGIDKAELLAALYNMALDHSHPTECVEISLLTVEIVILRLTVEVARGVIQEHNNKGQRLFFSDHKGVKLMVGIAGDKMNPALYDMNHGCCAAEKVVASLRVIEKQRKEALSTLKGNIVEYIECFASTDDDIQKALFSVSQMPCAKFTDCSILDRLLDLEKIDIKVNNTLSLSFHCSGDMQSENTAQELYDEHLKNYVEFRLKSLTRLSMPGKIEKAIKGALTSNNTQKLLGIIIKDSLVDLFATLDGESMSHKKAYNNVEAWQWKNSPEGSLTLSFEGQDVIDDLNVKLSNAIKQLQPDEVKNAPGSVIEVSTLNKQAKCSRVIVHC